MTFDKNGPRPPLPGRLLLVLLTAAGLQALPAQADGPLPVPPPPTPEQTSRILELVNQTGQFKMMASSDQGYQLSLLDESGRTIGVMSLETGPSDPGLRFHSRSFAIRIGNLVPDLSVVDTLVKTARHVAEHDDGFWAHPPPQLQGPALSWWEEPRNAPDETLTDITVGAIVFAILLGIWKRGRVTWEVKLPHLIPAAIQVILFVYWGLYWTAVRDHLPTLLVEVILAFALDACFALLRFGSWRIGASPLPIVLSSNLFAWFNTPGILINLVVAFASKTYIHRKGRHIFNPSSLGLALGGLTAFFAPQWVSFGGVFHTMNLPPNMMEMVVLLAIWPQTRFRIVPVSIGAIAALQCQDIPGALRPSMLLAIALLATDPATMPRQDFGKILFGIFLGFAMPFTSLQLRGHGSPDDFSKVIPIPIANALIPAFDWIGNKLWSGSMFAIETLRRRLGQVPAFFESTRQWKISDAGMIAIWLLFVVPGMWQEKPATFEPTLHWTMGTPHVIRDSDDVPRCEHNPLFCRPFSLVQEVSAWVHPEASTGPEIPKPPPALVQAPAQGG